MRLSADALVCAWARAVRYPRAPGAPAAPADLAAQTVRLDDGTTLLVTIDRAAEGPGAERFARVAVHRDDPPMTHAEAVPLASEAFVLGRFEPFPVESVRGADGKTMHYAIPLGAYKRARAERLRGEARRVLARGGGAVPQDEVEYGARQLACPPAALRGACNVARAAAGDARTLDFLSDKFLVPREWIEAQVGELADAPEAEDPAAGSADPGGDAPREPGRGR